MSTKKRFLMIAAFIIVAAVAIVICVECFTGERNAEYDGTLVREGIKGIYTIYL
jgi:hypothetical protein